MKTIEMPDDIDQLPTFNVGEFVRKFAKANGVEHSRSRLDDWTEAATSAAGDDIRLDHTEKLLVELKKRGLISGQKAARLLTNYMNEKAR